MRYVCIYICEREREGGRGDRGDVRYREEGITRGMRLYHIAPILLSIPPVGRYLLRSLFFLRTVEQKEITRAPGIPFALLRYPRPSSPPVFYAFSFPSLVPLFLSSFPFSGLLFLNRVPSLPTFSALFTWHFNTEKTLLYYIQNKRKRKRASKGKDLFKDT